MQSGPSSFVLALFASKTDREPRQIELSRDRLLARLTTHEEREEKDGPLFSPTRYREGQKRGLKGVSALSLLVLDFDRGTPPERLTPSWERWEYVLYSTFSHTPESPKWRAVFPLAREVPAEEWPALYRRLAAALGGGETDPACKDASRIYYWPSCPPGAPRFAEHHPGAPLDPDDFPEPEPAPAPAPPRPKAPAAANAAPAETGTRATPETLLGRALGRAGAGRNAAGLWLACQLRDNGFSAEEAEGVLREYADRVPPTAPSGDPDPYTFAEALHSIDQAYARAPRDAWSVSRRFSLRTSRPDVDTLAGLLKRAQEAVAAAADDPGAPFEPEALEALGQVRRWDPGNWARLKRELVRRRVSMRDLDRALEGEGETETGPAGILAGEMLDDCPFPELIVPQGYQLRRDATGRMAADDEGRVQFVPIALAPILLAGRARDTVTGQESVLLSWKWPDGPWRSTLVDRSSAMVGRKVAELASVGFPYLEESGKALVSYMTRLEASNRLTLPCARVTSHLGWQGPVDDSPFLLGATLVLPDGRTEETGTLSLDRPESWNARRVMFHGVGEGEAQLVHAFHAAGELERWAEALAPMSRFPRAMLVFYASFCAPLLQLFNVPNFIVDLSHSTTTGKTTVLRAAGSIWGNPDERTPASVLGTWDATRVWTERASHVLSGLPLLMDDTKKAKNDRIVAELIYAVASGRGRGRGTIGGLAGTSYWRTVLLSTGEQPATSFTQDGGTRTRVLSIQGLPFGRRDPEVGQLAKDLNRALCQHYGHAGVRFLAWLMRERARWDEWRTTYEQWSDYYASQPPSPEAGRLAQYAALVTVAGIMAHRALPLPWEYANPMGALWGELAAEAADAAGELRALQDVLSWAHAHERTFIRNVGGHWRRPDGAHEIAGRWDGGEGWEFIAFFPTVLRRVLQDQGFQPEAILTGWRERGWLQHVPGKLTGRVRLEERTTLAFVIRREAFEALEAGADATREPGEDEG